MRPTKIQFDSGFEDDGLFSITFWFDRTGIPSYLSLARDEIEDSDFAYVEAEDQKYGFRTDDLTFTENDSIIELRFSDRSKSHFFWHNSKRVEIQVPKAELTEVKKYLDRICSGKYG